MINREKLLEFVREAHNEQSYDGQHYGVHLEDTEAILQEFGIEKGFGPLSQSCLCHDLFEDTSVTPEDLRAIGVDSYAILLTELVSDEPGKSRAERKAKTYPKIAQNYDAILVKLADRIANGRASKKAGSRHFRMYLDEYSAFRSALYREDVLAEKLWEELDRLMGFC